ncbi:hypothetical protein NECAME_09806 [Necator americanus]|uniref:Uncharacterized protein n=1 Tax=Necator americanus TaxID=51031 RepID=W2TCW6_NECAM|nr:hypothetical protein NECAME_09806 [Necator americanus]ETN79439.1 hypothetical protein NECAME_09806 [Necator americanus]
MTTQPHYYVVNTNIEGKLLTFLPVSAPVWKLWRMESEGLWGQIIVRKTELKRTLAMVCEPIGILPLHARTLRVPKR